MHSGHIICDILSYWTVSVYLFISHIVHSLLLHIYFSCSISYLISLPCREHVPQEIPRPRPRDKDHLPRAPPLPQGGWSVPAGVISTQRPILTRRKKHLDLRPVAHNKGKVDQSTDTAKAELTNQRSDVMR